MLAAHVLEAAGSLFGDEVGLDSDVSPEYARGVIETVVRVLGLAHDEDTATIAVLLGITPEFFAQVYPEPNEPIMEPREDDDTIKRAVSKRKPTIREWAKTQGIQVAERGKIPQSVMDAYHAENH